MSKFDLLTEDETQRAAKDGWLVGYVYDLRTLRWAVQVLPVRFAKPFTNASLAASHVVQQARQGSPLATKALQLVMASHSTKARKKK